jgi:hypothetical protein
MATKQCFNRVPNRPRERGTFTAALAAPNTAFSWRMTFAASLCLAACVGLCSCALSPNYNPAGLSANEALKVEKICQTVMGLNPSGVLYDNLWPDAPDPASISNDYRGCIASLSNSLKDSAEARAERQADRDCAARGLEAGSSALAECVLRDVDSTSNSGGIRTASLTVTPYTPTAVPDPSIPQTLRRQQLACAELGLEPGQRAFANCVHGLRNVLSARERALDYID